MRINLATILLLLGLTTGLACIPAATPPAKQPGPSETITTPTPLTPDGTAVPAETHSETTEDGQTQVSINMPDNPMANAVVQVEKREGGGFIVRGNMGLTGVIRRLGNQWRLDARFRFPTSGYTVGEPTLMALGTMHLDEVGASLETPTDQFLITIPVVLPPQDVVHAEVVEEVPVGLDIDAPENADFMIALSQF